MHVTGGVNQIFGLSARLPNYLFMGEKYHNPPFRPDSFLPFYGRNRSQPTFSPILGTLGARSKSSFYGRKEPKPAISPILPLSILWAKSTSTCVFAHTWRSRRAIQIILLWAKRGTTHHFAQTPSLLFMGEIDLNLRFRPYLALSARVPCHHFMGEKRHDPRFRPYLTHPALDPNHPYMGEKRHDPPFRPDSFSPLYGRNRPQPTFSPRLGAATELDPYVGVPLAARSKNMSAATGAHTTQIVPVSTLYPLTH